MLASLRKKIQNRSFSFTLAILICLFGAGSWIEINGIWVELPILVPESPQYWKLPSYLTVIIQIANIGPLLYVLSNRYIKYKGRKVVTEVPVICFVLSVGVIASFLLAFTWKETSFIDGKEYSTALIVLSFFLALVDCTSSVTFLPFMAFFPKQYMTIYYIGEGMSGFLPSIVSLIQGVGEKYYRCNTVNKIENSTAVSSIATSNNVTTVLNVTTSKNTTVVEVEYLETFPLFSAQVFFFIISALMLLSLFSFILLVRYLKKTKSTEINNDSNFYMKSKEDSSNEKHSTSKEELVSTNTKESLQDIAFLLFVTAIINGLSNGALPALTSYSCLPYGFDIYHLTLSLSAAANPIACFLFFFVKMESVLSIVIGVMIYIGSATYTILVAVRSPCPYLTDSDAGGIIVVSYRQQEEASVQ